MKSNFFCFITIRKPFPSGFRDSAVLASGASVSIFFLFFFWDSHFAFYEFLFIQQKEKEFSALLVQGRVQSSWRKTGLFSESFHVITRSLVSFHDFFFWALVILLSLSVLDKFLWACSYFFDWFLSWWLALLVKMC